MNYWWDVLMRELVDGEFLRGCTKFIYCILWTVLFLIAFMSEELGNLYKGQFFSFSSEITVGCGDEAAGHPVGSVGVSQNELCVCACVCYCALLLLWLICPKASDRLCLTHTHTHPYGHTASLHPGQRTITLDYRISRICTWVHSLDNQC